MDLSSALSQPKTWAFLFAAALYFLYKYGTRTFDHFSNQGISGPPPVPFVGNLWGIWKRNMIDYDNQLVKKYGKTFGFFDGTIPNLYTTDTDIIKSVCIKDFDHFTNQRNIEVRSKYFRKWIFITRDQEWKDIRSAVSPVFTSGKIKKMSLLIAKCAERLSEKLIATGENGGKINTRNAFGTFTIDVIAKCAFGMTIDNLGGENDPFTRNAEKVFNPSNSQSPLILLPLVFPKLGLLFGDEFVVTKEFRFFIDLLVGVVNDRAQSDTKFNDFVEMATESVSEMAKKSQTWTREEIEEIVISQASLFMVAGFDTTANTLTYAAYLLAKNPDIQEKLYDQVMSKIEQYGEVSHDMILDFPYVDQVIHEVLRLHSPVSRLERACNKDVNYNGIHIKSGMLVTIPIYPIHYSEEYYPNPHQFDPDRWAPENKHKLNPYAFLPFGLGPRNCIGLRFAMEQLKIALCTMVTKLRFVAIKETPDKLAIEDGMVFTIQPLNAFVGIASR